MNWKTTIALAAICLFSASVFAQTNVAQGKPVNPVGLEFFNGAGDSSLYPSVTDGLFLPPWNGWQNGTVWWVLGNCEHPDSHEICTIEINLEGEYSIESFVFQGDSDTFFLEYMDLGGGGWQLAWQVDPHPDDSGYFGAVQTRPNPEDNTQRHTLPEPIITNSLRVIPSPPLWVEPYYRGTDNLYSVTEIQAFGEPYFPDVDNDGIPDPDDNCPTVANPEQDDSDFDGLGNVCDPCPVNEENDADQDGLCENVDPNPGSADGDGDGICDGPIEVVDPACQSTVCLPDQSALWYLTCDHFDQNGNCDDYEFCTDASGQCEYSPVTCSAYSDDETCMAQITCRWTYYSNRCISNRPVACAVFDEVTCGVVSGACEWAGDHCAYRGFSLLNNECTAADRETCATLDYCMVNQDCLPLCSSGPDVCPLDHDPDQLDSNGDGVGDACDDSDNDGVDDLVDQCLSTAPGEIVDPSTGCSVWQLCPCAGPMGTNDTWRNHGKYVSCVTKTANVFAKLGLIKQKEKSHYTKAAARSSCGK